MRLVYYKIQVIMWFKNLKRYILLDFFMMKKKNCLLHLFYFIFPLYDILFIDYDLLHIYLSLLFYFVSIVRKIQTWIYVLKKNIPIKHDPDSVKRRHLHVQMHIKGQKDMWPHLECENYLRFVPVVVSTFSTMIVYLFRIQKSLQQLGFPDSLVG